LKATLFATANNVALHHGRQLDVVRIATAREMHCVWGLPAKLSLTGLNPVKYFTETCKSIGRIE
jgi:hypothetical protein